MKNLFRWVSVALLFLSVIPMMAQQSKRNINVDNQGEHKYQAPMYLMDSPKRIQDQYIVVFHKGVSQDDVKGLADQVDGFVPPGQAKSKRFGAALNGFSGFIPPGQLRKLREDTRVAYIEADTVVQVGLVENAASWGLDRVDQADLPLDGLYDDLGNDGSGVHVYILDSGVCDHNDFGSRFTAQDYIAPGVTGNPCVSSNSGHGTHVAGTAAGENYGVASGAFIHSVQVLSGSGSGSTSGVIAGVDWVAANRIDPAVANMSLGGGVSSALNNAVNNAVSSGVFFAVAAGNENTDACNRSPASASQACTVASSTSSDARSSFSNFGSCVDIFAPGSSITSTWNTGSSSTTSISGTSMASPHVAGAAARILSANPGFSPAQIKAELESAAATGKISGVNGSPNLLLQTGPGGGSPPPPPPPPPGCTNFGFLGQATNLSDTNSPWGADFTYFTVDVPAGACELEVSIFGGSGDADLYVQFGSAPDLSNYDCRPYLVGNNETCTIANPQAGTWWIGIEAYSSYSGLTVQATY